MPDIPALGSLAVSWPFLHPSGLWDAWGGGSLGTSHSACALPAGVPEGDQLELFSVLAAILHLGNIVVRGRDRRGDGCFVEVGEILLPAPQTGP